MENSSFQGIVKEESLEYEDMEILEINGFQVYVRYKEFYVIFDFVNRETWKLGITDENGNIDGINPRFILKTIIKFGKTVFERSEKVRDWRPACSQKVCYTMEITLLYTVSKTEQGKHHRPGRLLKACPGKRLERYHE